ncbi:long-chain-alcohol oxidase FAO4A [Cucurbita maxima]|uniref:long-chain-alcohol oxidase n=1 Tax=Cucurbita maxima TaxID=3661 RepID=A0A6J1IPF0_CUCMA|nr:long-chain-alcohol oxidase FAO4A [Cucurbita maxima]
MTEPGKLRDLKMGYFGAASSYGGDGESKPQLHQCVIELNGCADSLHDGGPAGISQHANSNYSLSAAEMESLAALCETFLPSVAATDGSASEFFETSASAAGTSERVGGMIKERVRHPKKWLMRMSLWMLSTWYGTYILCGNGSLSNHFPYFQRFSKVSQKKREQVVVSWSLSYFLLLRMFFRTIKILSHLAFFTQVDEEMNNISWKAIDYPGSDPQFKAKARQSEEWNLKEKVRSREIEEEEEELYGPLFKGIVNLEHQVVAVGALRKFGFPVTLLSPSTKSPSPSMIIKCDAVVVGSGSGGGVVGGVLASAGYKVVVLEKGSYCARTNLSLLEGPAMEEMYLSSGLVATDNMNVLILAGSTVGGGSTVNWSASIQTPSHVTREWSDEYELELFRSNLYKEALEVVCKRMGVQSEIDNEGFNNAILRKGCEELGCKAINIPRNSASDHYCGWCCLGCKNGRKKGTAETWLVDLVRSGNGAILPGCEAIRITQEKDGRERNRAKGVAFEFECGSEAKQMCLVESKVTIVACGALCTPPLLKRSGLRNPNIGKNLHLHPVAMAWGYFPAETDESWPEKDKKSYEGGIMTAMCNIGSSPDQEPGYGGAVIQTPALHPGLFSILMPWVSGTNIKQRMCKFSRTAHVFALARDKGSGTVESSSSLSYIMDDGDEKNLQKGLEKALKILGAAGAEEIGTHHNKGRSINVKKVSYREYERFVKEESSRPLKDLLTPICSAHQMGSCRMGIGAKDSVVNQRGETWEVEGLFVADSSVFPTALGVNPMVTVQAIAYCTAQSVLETLKRKRN